MARRHSRLGISLLAVQIVIIVVSLVFLAAQILLKDEYQMRNLQKEMTHLLWKSYEYKQYELHQVRGLNNHLKSSTVQPRTVVEPTLIGQLLPLPHRSFEKQARLNKTTKTMSDIEAEMRERRNNIIKLCNTSAYSQQHGPMKYRPFAFKRLQWCMIPKSGSTFLQRELSPTMKKMGVDKNKHPPTFTLVREPYSRIVSAFFSKIVGHPGWWPSLGVNIARKFRTLPSPKSAGCGHNITFKEFIQYFIHSYHNKWWQNDHFLPMSSVCNVCKNVPDYVAKLETVKDHMKIILRSVNVSADTGTPFIEVKHLAELFMSFKHKFVKCAPMCMLLNRYWWGQQGTGLIANDLELPVKGKACDEVTGKQLADMAWEAHLKTVGRISKSEQKRNTSKELWRTVPMDDRLKVREILARDCALFGYNPSPDIVFQN